MVALQGGREEDEEEAASLAMEVEDVQEELGEAKRLLLRARGKMGEEEKRARPARGRGGQRGGNDRHGTSVSLVGTPGKNKCGRWSQKVMELGMELVGKNLGGEQAGSVTWAFVEFQHPHLVENEDCHTPSAARLKEWRMFFGPICHFIAVSTIRAAVWVHLVHDATTEGVTSIFQTAAHVEMPGSSIAQFPEKVRPASVWGRRDRDVARPGAAAHRPREWGLRQRLTSSTRKKKSRRL